MKVRYFLSIALLTIFSALDGECQETIFMLLKSDSQLANESFEKGNFPAALHLYLQIVRKKQFPGDTYLNIARCYYFLKQYEPAVTAYEKHEKLALNDIYNYAEAQAGLGNYEKAIEYYKKYLTVSPDDDLIIKKIWRLNNIRFLYEDSLHYAVRPISINTRNGEFGAVPYKNGVVFMSNRNGVQVVDQINAAVNAPFYHIYYAEALKDTVLEKESLQYGKPANFSNVFNAKYHVGPIAFYQQAHKMVFTTTATEAGKNGERTLQLFFAAEQEGNWQIVSPFPYNSVNYSITDPAINQDGNILLFSSDMKGGFGGKDLYQSRYINGNWTKPVNLGASINTSRDEAFPYLHPNQTLFFSSNGHAGMGGLDIYKVQRYDQSFGEVTNLGYPLNTHHDDFGIIIDSIQTHGYFSSNRKRGGFDDDIYEFDMDIQTYPLEISGLIKFKEDNWMDSSALKILPHAKLQLIDYIKNITVYETVSDSTGNFSLVIPYFSKYKISVTGENIMEGIVSFEIPKHRKLHNEYEIVVVKDAFKETENQ